MNVFNNVNQAGHLYGASILSPLVPHQERVYDAAFDALLYTGLYRAWVKKIWTMPLLIIPLLTESIPEDISSFPM